MFTPRPEAVAREILRVLRPGGRIAFTTWPAEGPTGELLKVMAKYVPPPPGAPSPLQWGVPGTIRARLGSHVRDVEHDRGIVEFYALSPMHVWNIFSTCYGPTVRAVELAGHERLADLQRDFVEAVRPHWRDNVFYQPYLLTRAVKTMEARAPGDRSK